MTEINNEKLEYIIQLNIVLYQPKFKNKQFKKNKIKGVASKI